MAMQTIIIIDLDFTGYEPSLSPHEFSNLSSTLSERAQGVLYNLATTHRYGIPYEQSITELPAVSSTVIAFPQIKIHRKLDKTIRYKRAAAFPRQHEPWTPVKYHPDNTYQTQTPSSQTERNKPSVGSSHPRSPGAKSPRHDDHSHRGCS
jgi:hypothetical protein